MYPDFSYILHAIFGTAPDNAFSIIKTFGLFLILAFLASALTLKSELKRKEREGLLKPVKEKIVTGKAPTPVEIGWNAFLGFLLGFKLPYIIMRFEEFQRDAAGVLFSSQGTLIWGLLAGALIGGLKYLDARRKKGQKPTEVLADVWPHQRIGDITVIAAFSGIAGAKLAVPFESGDNFRDFLEDPLGQLLSGSGLAIYGGLILAFVVVLWYIRKKQIPALHMMDAVAPALMVGYAVGRIGCQLSGDGDWGVTNILASPSWWFLPEWAWAYDYPHNVLNEGVMIEGCTWLHCRKLPQPVFPTPLYETIAAFLIAGILWLLRKRIRVPGVLFFIYVIFTGIERYFIEKIRVNPDIKIAGIEATQAEYISVMLLMIGVAGLIWCMRRKP